MNPMTHAATHLYPYLVELATAANKELYYRRGNDMASPGAFSSEEGMRMTPSQTVVHVLNNQQKYTSVSALMKVLEKNGVSCKFHELATVLHDLQTNGIVEFDDRRGYKLTEQIVQFIHALKETSKVPSLGIENFTEGTTMPKNNSIDSNDAAIRELAIAIGTGAGADKGALSFYARNLFIGGALTKEEMIEAMQGYIDFDVREFNRILTQLKKDHIVTMDDETKKYTISDAMRTLILEINPGALPDSIPHEGDKKEETVNTENNQQQGIKVVTTPMTTDGDEGGEVTGVDIQVTLTDKVVTTDDRRLVPAPVKANSDELVLHHTDKPDVSDDKLKEAKSGFMSDVEKIHANKENVALADEVVGSCKIVSEPAKLIRALYLETSDSFVDFQTLNNRFDVSGERAALFTQIVTDLIERGLIKKLRTTDGDVYVVSVAFVHLLKAAADDAERNSAARGNTDTDRFEVGDAKVGKATSTLSPDGLSGEAVEKPSAVPYLEVREAPAPKSRGNDGFDSQDKVNAGNTDWNFSPDDDVVRIEWIIFGKTFTPKEAYELYSASLDFVSFVDANSSVNAQFVSHDLTFTRERAAALIKHFNYYGMK
jgi:hypothetical protein